MTIAETVRATIISLGHPVTWTPHGGQGVSVPALITDQPDGKTQTSGRDARVAQIRVSKLDCAAIGYRDTFVEADGTVWSVIDANRIVNDRSASTWRVPVETSVRGKF